MFSLTIEEYESIFDFQAGVCYICKKPPKSVRLSVDHDHKTGLIRGLLCWSCNTALGKWKDDAVRLRLALDYIENPPAVQALKEERFGVKGRTTNKRRRKRSSSKKVKKK